MRLVVFVALVAAFACSSAPKPAVESAPPPGARRSDTPMMRMAIREGERFYPATGDSALSAFVPDVPPYDSGGVCNISKPFGPGVTMVTAYFPSIDSARTNVGLTFDSSGHLVRFYDRRGSVYVRYPPGSTPEQRDSIRMLAESRVRSTSISFDYPVNQAIARNSGGGKPTVAVLGTVRSMENLEKLGPPKARIQRVRQLCGV